MRICLERREFVATLGGTGEAEQPWSAIMQLIRYLMLRYLLTTETGSETRTDPRAGDPGWSYAPLIAFAVSFLPYILMTISAASPNSGFDVMLVVFIAINLAFLGLFFITRWKIRKAIEQRIPTRSIKAAMWSSLILMGIVASIPYLLPWILSMGAPHERGLGVALGIAMGTLLVLQIVVMPLVGVYGWFKGRAFYADDPVKGVRKEDSVAIDAIVARWDSKQG
jgi:hypothetical protein